MHKFGGASLADSAAVRHAVEIVRRHRPEPTVVVVSAMAGTTDALLAVAQQAGSGESRTVASLIARLRSRRVSTMLQGANLYVLHYTTPRRNIRFARLGMSADELDDAPTADDLLAYWRQATTGK